jgi:DMSO reductase anchor subunit
LEVFELITFIFAIWVLKRWGTVFYHSKVAAWKHPTTHGSFFVSGLLNGVALLSLLHLQEVKSGTLYFILVILLAFDLLIVFARFQYLAKSGEMTNRIARSLMGRQILYFGSRIIIGIFMPAIFILYNIIRGEGDLKGVEILILLGTLIDRYLFVDIALARD